MSETIRAFVAVELPTKVVNVLSGLIDELRAAGIPGLRTVRPDSVHLTLKFLGDVESGRVPAVVQAMEAAAQDRRSFTLSLGEPGVFPARGAPRVLWVGLSGDMDLLKAFQLALEDSFEELGFERDRRGFNPHLTIGRLGDRVPGRERRRAADVLLASAVSNEERIPVDSVSLMRSRLTPDGAVYTRLASVSLTDSVET